MRIRDIEKAVSLSSTDLQGISIDLSEGSAQFGQIKICQVSGLLSINLICRDEQYPPRELSFTHTAQGIIILAKSPWARPYGERKRTDAILCLNKHGKWFVIIGDLPNEDEMKQALIIPCLPPKESFLFKP